MNGNLCREARREIDQSELHQSLSAGTQAHVAACATCKTFGDERRRLRELVGGLKPVTAPADFEMRLRARIARERDVPRPAFIFRLVMSTPAIVVAAVLVIAVGVVVFLSQRKPPQAPAQAKTGGIERVSPAPTSTVIAKDEGAGVEQPKPVVDSGADKSKVSPTIARTTPKSASPVNTASSVDDFAVKRAQSFRLSDRDGEVSLVAPNRPMVVTMYDENGATHKIQLPPISFGSQRLTDNRKQVSMTNAKDW